MSKIQKLLDNFIKELFYKAGKAKVYNNFTANLALKQLLVNQNKKVALMKK